MEYIKPHRVISREVTEKDLVKVQCDAKEMYEMYGINGKFVALSHCQVTSEDPLRFFITNNGTVIANPKITNHVNYFVNSVEGCMTFPGREFIAKKRWRKIEAEWYEIEEGKLVKKESTLKDLTAFIMQHETDHMNGVYCYDEIDNEGGAE